MQAVKTVTLDAHAEWGQMVVMSPEGEIVIELQVETAAEEVRRVVSGIPGPKRAVMENGPLSAMSHDALDGLAEQVVSCVAAQRVSRGPNRARRGRSWRRS